MKEQIFIFGAGFVGKYALKELKEKYNIIGFLDNNISLKNKKVEEYRIYQPNDVFELKKYKIVICIFNFEKQILLQLIQLGCRNISLFDFDKNDIFKINIDENGMFLPIIPYVETHVMNSCNLKCKACSHFSSVFSDGDYPNYEKFKQDIKQLSLICQVKKIRLLGGEPLLNENLLEYLKVVVEYFPYSDIHIVSNGLLIDRINIEILNYMSDNEIVFDISNYIPTNIKINRIKDILNNYKVKFSFQEEVIENFEIQLTEQSIHDGNESQKNCMQSKCTILKDGKLYKCPMSAYISVYNKKFKRDFPIESGVDIYITHDDFEKNINKLRNNTIGFCNYCLEQPKSIKWEVCNNPMFYDWIGE